ncbi:hypothetical protein LOK49_LG07G03288 [Camellia lanceoleosa]|uniref:Uncharacterized protein n=1 Tax=Camellia lanceoleosa TaxID=1840588 RepID=A0ACC0H024_9ERIC|nr:hypothetical protein LOK49_LG07G03288 [Camellia lanceoleosa]
MRVSLRFKTLSAGNTSRNPSGTISRGILPCRSRLDTFGHRISQSGLLLPLAILITGVCCIRHLGCLKMAGFRAGAAPALSTHLLTVVLQSLNFTEPLKKLGGEVLICPQKQPRAL